MFLGVFIVNTAHGLLHIASGAIFVIASAVGARAARLWFQLFGFAYAALSAIGFAAGDEMIFNLISNNRNDSWGHGGLALAMLLIGFAFPREAISGLAAPPTRERQTPSVHRALTPSPARHPPSAAP
jgi:hypothetical protein